MILRFIEYNSIDITVASQGSSVVDNPEYKICTPKALRECLYKIVEQDEPAFYLDSFYIESNNKSKYFSDYTIQNCFNKVIQLFIDIREQYSIRTDNINHIFLNVKFSDYPHINKTRLVKKLLQAYNTSKNITISLDTGILLSEMQELTADKDVFVFIEDNEIIINAKEEMNPNIVPPLNSEDVNSNSEALELNGYAASYREALELIEDQNSYREALELTEDQNSYSEASQLIDELTEEDLKMTEGVWVKHGLMGGVIDGCFTLACPCSIIQCAYE